MDIQPGKQNPGVAPPDCALLFYWPKRVCRKGPALRWACLARQGGNFNSGMIPGQNNYVSPSGAEALESLSLSVELQQQIFFQAFPL